MPVTYTLRVNSDSYTETREGFSWDIPEGYNAAYDLVGKHNSKSDSALYYLDENGATSNYTFGEIDRKSSAVGNSWRNVGVQFGDRVAVMLPQKPENILAHLASWKIGAISMPLSILFGTEAVKYRLQDSGAKLAVIDVKQLDTVQQIASDCPNLKYILVVGDQSKATLPEDENTVYQWFDTAIRWEQDSINIADTDQDTPAVIIYTSGSTGDPKGVLHTHDVWLGHCPAFQMYFEHNIEDGIFWTPADWAWIGALGDLVFPAWHYGRPVVGHPMEGFNPHTAFELMEEFAVTHTFLPPTAVRMLMSVDQPTNKYDLALQAICSGGEPLTQDILNWADTALNNVNVNELYGQTEANLLVANCSHWFQPKPGSMGKPVPGHEVKIADVDTRSLVETDEIGEIVVRRDDDPVIFEEYWNAPEKTVDATIEINGEQWHRTGDIARRDEDGYIWFVSRNDDLIITSGYRVAPREVEEIILQHNDVAQVGVTGVSDKTRGEIIKAFVELTDDADTSNTLKNEIRNLVRTQLADYEYPREIEFRDELPKTVTGKIRRSELTD